jgi:hypothetical protein
MKQPESPQKQALGPLTFPVAAIEEIAWAGGPWGRREWFFLENIRRGDSNLFGLMQRDDIAGARRRGPFSWVFTHEFPREIQSLTRLRRMSTDD